MNWTDHAVHDAIDSITAQQWRPLIRLAFVGASTDQRSVYVGV
jgi:hypothetical protein